MDYSDSTLEQNRPKEQSSPFEFEVKRETPEEIVAENVSQQLLSNAFEFQKTDNEAIDGHNPESMEHSLSEPIVEEPIHQNIDIQSEQRFSGIPIQQYIYDEEEEDEEESDDEIDMEPIERHRTDEESLAFRGSPETKSENIFDIPNEPQNQSKEELLYHLSDDNVLTAQSYGIGSDLRIDSTSSEPNSQELSAYELNSDDPFSTPHKHKTESNKETEKEFERFVEKCEPFETISTDLEELKPKVSTNLINLDQSLRQPSESSPSGVPIAYESHSMIESMSESEIEPNHALSDAFNTIARDKGTDVLPSSAGDKRLSDSHIESIPESTNKSETDFNPTLSPNLDCFEPTFTSSTHHLEEDIPSQQITSSQPIEIIEEPPILSFTETKATKADEPQKEIIFAKMAKQESEHAVITSTNECNCPFSPSAWFNPNQLNGTVAELVYWRDPKKSGVVFGAGLAILLSLTVFSIISVIAYTSLAALSVTLSFRIYKNILQAVQKTNEGHPFKEYLEVEITPSSERIHEIVDSFVSHSNCTIKKLRSVFLVEDIIDSLKFVVLFWCLTYIGSWFNGLTLIILAYLGLFSIPKVYEMNKTQIDQYLSLASTQINEITSKIRAKIPFPAKKEKDN